MAVPHRPTSRLRVRAWRNDRRLAELITEPMGGLVSPAEVGAALADASAQGFTGVVTPALPPYEWRPYLDAGLEIRERLHLLGRDLLALPADGDQPLVRVPRARFADLVRIDHAAFDGFWSMDEAAIREAMRATLSSRLRMTAAATGYALFGRAGERGYLQRLAVHPDAQGQGLGTRLVVDGLRWLRRRRVTEVLVNTQESNTHAVDVYEHLGFRHRPGGLAVLHAELPRHAP